MKVTTDLGDWSTLPRRYQLLIVAIALSALGAAVAGFTNAVPVAVVMVLALNVGIAVQWVFTRRRPWWRDESTTEPDLIDRSFGQRLAAVIAVDGIVAALVLAGAFAG